MPASSVSFNRVTCRSREGAWIEICRGTLRYILHSVAPARERGLKSGEAEHIYLVRSRSREGAWIEMVLASAMAIYSLCRSREGAWIEMNR